MEEEPRIEQVDLDKVRVKIEVLGEAADKSKRETIIAYGLSLFAVVAHSFIPDSLVGLKCLDSAVGGGTLVFAALRVLNYFLCVEAIETLDSLDEMKVDQNRSGSLF